MRFSAFNGYAPAPPFAVLDENEGFVYANSVFKALFGDAVLTREDDFTLGGHGHVCQRVPITLSSSAYTLCEMAVGVAGKRAPAPEHFTTLLGLINGVSDGGRIRKRPCGTRYLLSLWESLLSEELDEDVAIANLDSMGRGIYCSLNAQGLLIVLSCLYRLVSGNPLLVLVGDDCVLIRIRGDFGADVFMRDFLCELAHASGFALDFCDGGAAITLKRFSAKTFTAFSPTKEYAEEAMQLALLGLM